jgi:hypothetical protein
LLETRPALLLLFGWRQFQKWVSQRLFAAASVTAIANACLAYFLSVLTLSSYAKSMSHETINWFGGASALLMLTFALEDVASALTNSERRSARVGVREIIRRLMTP